MTARAAERVKTWPVIEVFGPTIQGEGALAGLPTHFIRFGGCDYRCSWCDSMHAVEPAEVKANAEKIGSVELLHRLERLAGAPSWITLSGGNPALLDLTELVDVLQNADWRVCVETQGSRWREWLADVDQLTVSPKPPSSGMAELVARDLPGFMEHATEARKRNSICELDCIKIVVFDEADLDWATGVFDKYPDWTRFLSCGTDRPAGEAESAELTLELLSERYRWLCESVAVEPALADVRVLPQLHVIAWQHAKGV